MRALNTIHARLLANLRQAIAAEPELFWCVSTPDALAIEAVDSEPWASATFQGERHRLDLRLTGAMAAVEGAADAIERMLETIDVQLPRAFLASAEIGEATVGWGDDGRATARLTLELLVIDAD